MTLIGFDFSINKPACCIFDGYEYTFWIWPYGVPRNILDIYVENGVNVFYRDDDKEKGDSLSSKMRYEITNADYLSQIILDSIHSYCYNNTYLSFEGLSYGSKGDVVLQLGGYKYILMQKFRQLINLNKMYTYSPITVKSVAGCAKKGMNKKDMINSFIKNGPDCKFRLTLSKYPEIFQSKKAKNWIVCIDDIIDSYWVLETLRIKEKLNENRDSASS